MRNTREERHDERNVGRTSGKGEGREGATGGRAETPG